jgi:hypothetical protein
MFLYLKITKKFQFVFETPGNLEMEQKLVMIDVASNEVFDLVERTRDGFPLRVNLDYLLDNFWVVKKMIPVTNANKESLGYLYVLLERQHSY